MFSETARRRDLLAVVAALLALGFAASTASAQCNFDHPKKARKFTGELVQAFVPCGGIGGTTPNTATGGGVPACQPPETFNQLYESPANGWRMDPLKFQGRVQLKIRKACTGKAKGTSLPPCNPLDTALNPPGSADLEVQLKLRGVIDAGGPANGVGALWTLTRATMYDWTAGDVTILDFPAGFPFDLAKGETSMKTSVDAHLNSLNLQSLPACSSLEIVDINVVDENGTTFARIGTWLMP